jgi:quinoprotein glucose dehydrogenase
VNAHARSHRARGTGASQKTAKTRTRLGWAAGVFSVLAAGLLLWTLPASSQQSALSIAPKPGEWRYTYGDLGSTRYSPLDQINKDNVQDLRIAWRWKSDNFGYPPEYKNENTPIMVNGVLYFGAGWERDIVAIDAATGRTLWTWHPDEGERAEKSPRKTSGRGVGYWTDGKEERIFTVTVGFHLVALDAKTGLPVPSFGNNGVVDLMSELNQPGNHISEIGNTSPPTVVGNVVIVPPSHENVTTLSMRHTRGDVMAFDVRTGKKLWTFHTIPQKGEYGNDTWKDNSWTYTGHTGVWAPISVDPELGYAYLPVETPTNDYYGGHRLGNDLFGNSLVCVDVKTGKRIWDFQISHHDIWDYDLPAAPILADITVDGKPVKAVVQLTKQSFAYVFDRVTGKPVWPIVERPVPQSDVPGEATSPTQPFPTKPPAYDRQSPITENDVVDFTPELKAEALEMLKQYRNGPLYTPASRAMPGGTKGTLQSPSGGGGSMWEGGVFDPETGVLYVSSISTVRVLTLAKNPKSDMNFSDVRGMPPLLVQGVPILKPPYGRITAIDLNKGEPLWMIPNGEPPRRISSLPALHGVQLPKTGSPSRADMLVTKTLLFAGEGWGGEPVFRAYDKATGAVVWERQIPGVATGLPMTYMLNGKQYIVFSAGDQETGEPAEMIAFTLADRPATPAAQAQAPAEGAPAAQAGGNGAENTLTPEEAAEGWISLFDGRTLTGWWPSGKAVWRVEDGTISVTPGPGVTGFLRTTRSFSDFELKGDFWPEKRASNSGFFLRCPSSELGVGAFTCYEVNIFDESPLYPTGSVTYVQSTMPGPPVDNSGKWNSFDITADGSHLIVTLNGQITADTRDSKLTAGTIGLQAAGSGVLRFRNIKIRPIGGTHDDSQ